MASSLDDPAANVPSGPPAAPPRAGELKRPFFPVALAGVLLVASTLACNTEPQSEAAPKGPAPTPAPAPAADNSDEIRTLEAELDDLGARFKELKSQVDARPAPPAAPDLGPIQTKLDSLAKSHDELAELPKKVSDLEERVGRLDKAVADLKSELGDLRAEIKKVGDVAAANSKSLESSRTAETARPANRADSELERGIALFKGRKYSEASAVFRSLTESNPDDARAWYYAGLSNGFATKDWQGETLRLVNQGVEREKAGTPDTAKIDEALAGLKPAATRTWLDYYRKKARP
jgi:tetratricopeptide (TPR) repeat protein